MSVLVTVVEAEEDVVLGLDNVENLTIYPNPTTEYLYISNSDYRAYQIYTASGQLVDASAIIDQQIDVRKLVAGVFTTSC